MSPTIVGMIGLGLLLILFSVRVPVGFALMLVGLLGTWYLASFEAAIWSIAAIPYRTTSRYVLITIPLFILMGFFADAGGLMRNLYAVARQWVGHLPGGLVLATIGSCAMFGACCGSTTATAAIFGKASLPEMIRYGCDRKLAAGSIAAAGALAMVIPPSSHMVIIGVLTEQSVAKLLIAGILPGILMAFLFMTMVAFRVMRNPGLATRVHGATWRSRVSSLKDMWPLLVIMSIIVGGIYTGVFTPTEAGAVAAAAALLIPLVTHQLTYNGFKQAVIKTGSITCMIFVIIIGALVFSQFFALTGMAFSVGEFLVSLDVHRLVIFGLFCALYLFLGCFLDDLAMMMLTIPIIYPILLSLGFDPIWLGVIIVILIQAAVITPPLGINVFVVRSVAPDIPMGDIFKGILPFLFVEILVIGILVLFPQIALVLPSGMKG